jgi:hypothetical protein
MLKSFPIIKVIKKNWKVIALLVLLLVFALLVLALYPKIQEGIDNTDFQVGITETSATVKDAKGAVKSNHPGMSKSTINADGDNVVITDLSGGQKYKGVSLLDNNGKPIVSGQTIFTKLKADQIVPPTFNVSDLSNVHTQIDPTSGEAKEICAYIKFDGTKCIEWRTAGPGTENPGYTVTGYKIKSGDKNLSFDLIENPDTGEEGWCKLSGFSPGEKYKITVSAVCNLYALHKRSKGSIFTSGKNIKLDKAKDFTESVPSKEIEIATAPYPVTNIECVITPSKTQGMKMATIKFKTVNGKSTTYTTNKNCDAASGIKEYGASVDNSGNGTIIIDNIKTGVNWTDCFINAKICATAAQDSSKANTCPAAACNITVPSNRVLKKITTPLPKSTFTIKT